MPPPPGHRDCEPTAFDGASDAIHAILFSRSPPRPTLIGITGPVGSGKSTLAGRLSTCVIPTDAYLPDYAGLPVAERDLPERSALDELAAHLAILAAGRPTSIPVWSFQEHRRTGTRRVEPGEIIVVEGIHALHASVRTHLDLAIFVEADAPLRWARWKHLERTGQRGWGVERAREHFDRVAEPSFARYADAYRAAADLIVLNSHHQPPPLPEPADES